jgi:hypothetical protein
LALVLPLLLLVIGGVIDFGRALYTKVIITNAAREGARAAVSSSATLADITDRAKASTPGWTTPTFTVPSSAKLCNAGEPQAIMVANYNFEWLILKPALRLVGASDALPDVLSAKAVMKCGG